MIPMIPTTGTLRALLARDPQFFAQNLNRFHTFDLFVLPTTLVPVTASAAFNGTKRNQVFDTQNGQSDSHNLSLLTAIRSCAT